MNKTLEAYKGLISFLGEALPEEFDAVLFDLTEKGYPTVEQSDWGSREINDIRRFLREKIKSETVEKESCLMNAVIPTAEKRLLKVSVYVICEKEITVGALAITMEMDIFFRMARFVESRLKISGDGGQAISLLGQYDEDIIINDLDEIGSFVDGFGTPPSEMTPTERREVFLDLYDTGVFKIKGAIPKAAEALGISEKTIYRYISEIKKARK